MNPNYWHQKDCCCKQGSRRWFKIWKFCIWLIRKLFVRTVIEWFTNPHHTDNMGLKCNQLEGASVENHKHSRGTTNSSGNSTKRRRKLTRPPLCKPRNFLHSLFRWYFKSRNALHDDCSQSTNSDYEISINALNCNEDESSLAYRQHKIANTLQSPSSSNLSHSHYLVRQSICLYAASSVILALCYLTTPSSATETPSHPV